MNWWAKWPKAGLGRWPDEDRANAGKFFVGMYHDVCIQCRHPQQRSSKYHDAFKVVGPFLQMILFFLHPCKLTWNTIFSGLVFKDISFPKKR